MTSPIQAATYLGAEMKGRQNLHTLPSECSDKIAQICNADARKSARAGALAQHILSLSSDMRAETNPTELAKLKAELQRTRKEEEARGKLSPQERRKLNRAFAGEDFSLRTWINSAAASALYRFAPASYELNKGQTRVDLLKKTRDQGEAEEQKVRTAKAAGLSEDERIAQMNRDVAKAVREGKPDTTPLARTRVINPKRNIVQQGSTRWPVEQLTYPTFMRTHEVDRGNAFVIWLFEDQVRAKLTAQIKAEAAAGNCLSAEARDAAIREGTARILELQRLEERLICDIEEHDSIFLDRLPSRHPWALLEIEPLTDEDLEFED